MKRKKFFKDLAIKVKTYISEATDSNDFLKEPLKTLGPLLGNLVKEKLINSYWIREQEGDIILYLTMPTYGITHMVLVDALTIEDVVNHINKFKNVSNKRILDKLFIENLFIEKTKK
jgi:hypothetical protein